jgi:membrane-bound lytic murein transglycosylase A
MEFIRYKKPIFFILFVVLSSSIFISYDKYKHWRTDKFRFNEGWRSNYTDDGKRRSADVLPMIFTPSDQSDTLYTPRITSATANALDRQGTLMNRKREANMKELGMLQVTNKELEQTVAILKTFQGAHPYYLQQYLDFYQIAGEDKRGNVLFTGYYTPVMPIKKNPDNVYKYPIYARPKKWDGKLPDREAIQNGIFAGQGLELGYASSLRDIYAMHIQGSCMVDYLDDGNKHAFFAYDGNNGYASNTYNQPKTSGQYIDIADSLATMSVLAQNPAYIFFKPQLIKPEGAANVALTDMCSVAVDPRYIPLGSCLLAEMPISDEKGRFLRHEYKFLLAQDVGGAIEGAGHIDVYCGKGLVGKYKAKKMRHYGSIWLLLPKKQVQIPFR